MIIINILFFLIYIVTCITCVRIAKKETGSAISITSMFVLPYMIICSFQEFVCLAFSFFSLPDAVYWMINIVFIISTCATEVLLTRITKTQCIQQSFTDFYNTFYTSKSFFIISVVIITATTVSSIRMVKSIDLTFLLQEDFQEDFAASSGGNFYIRLITIILAVYFLGVNKSKWGYVLGALCFVPHIVVNTKGILFIPIIAILFTQFLLGRVKNLKKNFLTLGFAGTVIFLCSYLIEDLIYQENVDIERLSFLGEKMIVYVLAGVQEFAINVRDGIHHNPNYVNITHAPINNFFAKFGLATSVSNVNNEFNRLIGVLPHYGQAYSNVNGFIGTLYLFNGLFGGLLFNIVLVIITFLLKLKAISTKRPFWIVLFTLFLSAFFLGWFEFYLMHTFWVYFILLTILIDFLYRIISVPLKSGRVNN